MLIFQGVPGQNGPAALCGAAEPEYRFRSAAPPIANPEELGGRDGGGMCVFR